MRWRLLDPRRFVCAFAGMGAANAVVDTLRLPVPQDLDLILRLSLVVVFSAVSMSILKHYGQPPNTPLDTRRVL